ncbi:hypothetical protein M422DRAFT_781339, partial [Sphaerobolus stellatus SS14]
MMGGSLRYNLAYPHIYLRPSNPNRARTLQERFQPYGYIGIDIDFSDNSPHSIHVVCDELVLVGNETYTANGKNLEIRCRHLTFAEGLSSNVEDNRKVTFDLSGVNSQALTAEVQKNAISQDQDSLNAKAPG